MKAKRIALVLTASLIAAACSLTRDYPRETRYFVLEPAAGPSTANRRNETLRVGTVRVSPSFASSELVYRFDDVRFTSDFYNRLMAPPANMLAGRIGEWLERSGPFRFVSQPGAAAATDYVLEAVFTDLYGDFRPGRVPASVMNVQMYLIDAAAGGARAAYSRAFERRIDLDESTPDAVARGYSIALAQILAELGADLARLPVR